MVGVVNYEKMKKDFMEKVYQKMEQELSDCLEYVRSHSIETQDYLRNSWDKCLRKLGGKYQKLQDSGTTGELAYGYLSFLWSGVLEQRNWYRMDYYDSRSCISDVECGERFDISLVLKRFEQGSDEIRDIFASQAAVTRSATATCGKQRNGQRGIVWSRGRDWCIRNAKGTGYVAVLQEAIGIQQQCGWLYGIQGMDGIL